MSEWKEIPGYSSVYQINRDGDVRVVREGKKPRILKQRCIKWHDRRPSVRMITRNGSYSRVIVASLMRDTFMGGQRPGFVVMHVDGNTLNNALYNLRFAKQSEVGRRTGKSNRKPVYKIDKATGEIVETYRSAKECAIAEHCDSSTITNICRNAYKTSVIFGDEYTFAYTDDYEEKMMRQERNEREKARRQAEKAAREEV